MANSSEQQSRGSRNGSDRIETLYDQYQRNLPSSSEEKSSKGKFHNRVDKFFKAAARGDNPSSNKDQTQADNPAAPPNGKATQTQNNSDEGSSSQKRKIRKTYSHPPKVRGFEYDERSLEMMLLEGGKDNSFKTIGVVGPPGVGKTTLCKSILENERVKRSYGRRIWVSLPEKPEDETTLDHAGATEDIVELIYDEHKLPRLLRDQQLKEKKYLIVLDDVGEGEIDSYYNALKACFSDELPKEKGGAVIVTSRSEEAAKKVIGDKHLHRLLPLSDPKSCWLIYTDAVEGFPTPEDATASKDVMEELMKKSGGLPGAAQMMGKIKAAKKGNNNSSLRS